MVQVTSCSLKISLHFEKLFPKNKYVQWIQSSLPNRGFGPK